MTSLTALCPLYAVASSEAFGGIVVIGGGGGSVKTGVRNAIVVLRWDGARGKEKAEVLFTAGTGSDCVRNIALQERDVALDSVRPPGLEVAGERAVFLAHGHQNLCTLSLLVDSKILKEVATTVTVERAEGVTEETDDDAPEQKCVALAPVPEGSSSSAPALLFTGASTGAVRSWSVPSLRPVREYAGHAGPVTCLALSADGSLLCSTSADASSNVWGVASGSALWRVVAGSSQLPVGVCGFRGCAFAPAGFLRLACSARRSGSLVATWELAGGEAKEGRPREPRLCRATAVVRDAHTAFASSGELVALGTRDGGVSVARNPDARAVRGGRLASAHGLAVTGVALSPRGSSHVVSVGPDGRVFWTSVSKLSGGSRWLALALLLSLVVLVLCVVYGRQLPSSGAPASAPAAAPPQGPREGPHGAHKDAEDEEMFNPGAVLHGIRTKSFWRDADRVLKLFDRVPTPFSPSSPLLVLGAVGTVLLVVGVVMEVCEFKKNEENVLLCSSTGAVGGACAFNASSGSWLPAPVGCRRLLRAVVTETQTGEVEGAVSLMTLLEMVALLMLILQYVLYVCLFLLCPCLFFNEKGRRFLKKGEEKCERFWQIWELVTWPLILISATYVVAATHNPNPSDYTVTAAIRYTDNGAQRFFGNHTCFHRESDCDIFHPVFVLDTRTLEARQRNVSFWSCERNEEYFHEILEQGHRIFSFRVPPVQYIQPAVPTPEAAAEPRDLPSMVREVSVTLQGTVDTMAALRAGGYSNDVAATLDDQGRKLASALSVVRDLQTRITSFSATPSVPK
eukprot:m51a1_g36 putative wd40 repeat-containing protein (796) ;mRNA; r:136511-139916